MFFQVSHYNNEKQVKKKKSSNYLQEIYRK